MATGNKATLHRYRMNVPDDDAATIEWMAHQHSISLSLRMLIHEAIERNGMRDYFASAEGELVQLPRRGRPPRTVETVETTFVGTSKDVEETTQSAQSTSSDDIVARMQGLSNTGQSASRSRMQDMLNS